MYSQSNMIHCCQSPQIILLMMIRAARSFSTLGERLLAQKSRLFMQSGALQAIIPRTIRPAWTVQPHLISKLQTELNDPVWDLLDRGGKRFRPALCQLIAEVYHPTAEQQRQVMLAAACCQVIHNSTLIIDDILDKSLVRRGKPCIHRQYGLQRAILSGIYTHVKPLSALLGHVEASLRGQLAQVFLEQFNNLYEGQSLDVAWTNSLGSDPHFRIGLSDYLAMIQNKTAVLMRMGSRFTVRILGLGPTAERLYSKLSNDLGIAFQIVDDLLNLESKDYQKTKGFRGEDIYEGKLSFMVTHCLNHGNPNSVRRLREILALKTQDKHLIEEAIEILRAEGSLQAGRQLAEKQVGIFWSEDGRLIPEGLQKQNLRALSDFICARQT